MTRGRQTGVPGFSLIEMVMSVSVVSILLLAIGSVLRLTNYVDSNSAYDAGCAAQSADVASQIVADLNVALNFTEKTSTAVTFTVPDRSGSGTNDTIRYSWTGAVAQASPAIPAYCVTREYDGGAPVVVASDVRTFNLKYLYRAMSPAAAVAYSQMAAYNPSGGSASDWNIDVAQHWASQVFVPSAPVGTTAWTLTKVRLYLSGSAPADGIIQVQIRTTDVNHRPTSTVLATAQVAEASLTDSYGWMDVPFSLSNLSPAQSFAIVVSGAAGSGTVCTTSYLTGASPSPASSQYSCQSSNAGSTWTAPVNTGAYRFYVFGTVP